MAVLLRSGETNISNHFQCSPNFKERIEVTKDEFIDYIIEVAKQKEEPTQAGETKVSPLNEGVLLEKFFELMDTHATPQTVNDIAYSCFMVGKFMEQIDAPIGLLRGLKKMDGASIFAGIAMAMMKAERGTSKPAPSQEGAEKDTAVTEQ